MDKFIASCINLKTLNISGVINGNKPSFINKEINLIANGLEIENNYAILNVH